MGRRLLFLSLIVVMPALVCAQENPPVSCRTLAAADNFVGPDETIVNGMVCPKTKVSPGTNSASQTATPVPSPAISDGDAASVVDAAKAANKRVEAAKDAIRERAEQEKKLPSQDAEPDAPSVTPEAPAPVAAPPKTPDAPPRHAKPKMSLPVKPPASEVVAVTLKPASTKTLATPRAPQPAAVEANPESKAPAAVEDAADGPAEKPVSPSADAAQPAASPDPAASTDHGDVPQASKSISHTGDSQEAEQSHRPECTKEIMPGGGAPASAAKCMELLGQVVEDIGKL